VDGCLRGNSPAAGRRISANPEGKNDFVLSSLIAFSYQLPRMELRHLRYFVAVAEELNYRKASERLRVAQPALSSQIKDLEDELGVKLLDRNTGGVRLTNAGSAFLAESRLTLAQAQHAIVIAQEASKGLRGQLTIGYSGPLLMGFMPACLKRFHDKFPSVEVDLVEMPVADQITALEAGTLHIGFTIAGAAPLPKHLREVEVLRSLIRVALSRGHRLAKLKRIALAELENETILCISNKKGSILHGEAIRRIFTGRKLRLRPIRAIDGAEAFRASLEGGMGVSLIPQIGSLLGSRDLLFKPIKETGPDLILILHAVWHEKQTSQLTTNFIDLMRDMELPGSKTVSG
jgi:DNA-binding transcriptional LysR family regulator